MITNLDIQEIKCYLPNRYPFLLVDHVDDIEPGQYAKGYKNVTINEAFFQGHFPNNPLMPGMIQAEALFQMLSLTVLTLEGNAGKSLRGLSTKNIKFKDRVLPGSKFDMEANLAEWDGNKGIGTAKGFINGHEACSAEFEFEMMK